MQSHPLRRMRFGQYQASSAACTRHTYSSCATENLATYLATKHKETLDKKDCIAIIKLHEKLKASSKIPSTLLRELFPTADT